MSKSYAIGIDLGTTHSCVYVVQDGKPRVVHNIEGSNTTPSAIAFTKDGVLYGDNAIKHKQVKNIIRWIKLLIGRKFDDKVVEYMQKFCSFEIIKENSDIKIEVEIGGETKTFYPEEMSAIYISYLVHIAKEFLGKPVFKAVITVPANFNNAQRQATKLAAEMAGLEVFALLNEPTAAAIAYTTMYKSKNQHILMYDLGGGTFDVCVLKVGEEDLNVKSVAGNTHLGGEKFTENLFNYCKKQIKTELKGASFDNNKSDKRLRALCEKAKRRLSTIDTTTIEEEFLYNIEDIDIQVTRECFNKLNKDLFESTIDIVEQCLNDAKLEKSDIDRIIMVGGSSHIPEIKRLLQKIFPKTPIRKDINPDEVVAMGAAIVADQLNNRTKLSHICNAVTPLSLGMQCTINDQPDQMSVIIKRNSSIPYTATKLYTNLYDFSSSINLPIYEGENVLATKNNKLGELNIQVERRSKDKNIIAVTFDIDTNGILNIRAKETNGENEEFLKINQNWDKSKYDKILMKKNVTKYNNIKKYFSY